MTELRFPASESFTGPQGPPGPAGPPGPPGPAPATQVLARDYGAVVDWNGTTGTDDTVAVQNAIDYAASIGGGNVIIDGRCRCATVSNGLNDGLARVLRMSGDNVSLEITEGAELVFDGPNARGISIGMDNTGGTVFNQVTYPMQPATKGAYQLTLSTAADAGNFAAGDWIYVRTGQLLASGTDQPDAELAKVLSADATTGVVTLAWPLTKDYALEQYPTGHPNAPANAPLGISNLSSPNKVVTENVGITGRGTLTQRQNQPLMNGFATGFYFTGLKVNTVNHCQSMGYAYSLCENLDIDMTNTALKTWPLSVDRGATENTWKNIRVRSRGVPTFHIHEGASVTAQGIEAIYSNEANLTDTNVWDCRSRPGYVSLSRFRSVSARHNGSDVFFDASSVRGGDISGVRVEGPGGKINVSGSGFQCAGLEAQRILVVGPNSQNSYPDGVIRLSPPDFVGFAGTPTLETQNARHKGWTLKDGVTDSIYALARVPRGWKGMRLRILWANKSANAGNVFFGMYLRGLQPPDTLSAPIENSPSSVVTASSQWLLNESTVDSALFLNTGDMLSFELYRNGAHANDTLVGDVAIMAVTLERYENV